MPLPSHKHIQVGPVIVPVKSAGKKYGISQCDEETKRVVKLVAAAPEMLEALKAVAADKQIMGMHRAIRQLLNEAIELAEPSKNAL